MTSHRRRYDIVSITCSLGRPYILNVGSWEDNFKGVLPYGHGDHLCLVTRAIEQTLFLPPHPPPQIVFMWNFSSIDPVMSDKVYEDVDGRTDTGVIGILLAHS